MAAVAIVQGDEIVYAKGFGVRERGKDDPVTPETLMRIGSTTKSMTTMMMATLVAGPHRPRPAPQTEGALH